MSLRAEAWYTKKNMRTILIPPTMNMKSTISYVNWVKSPASYDTASDFLWRLPKNVILRASQNALNSSIAYPVHLADFWNYSQPSRASRRVINLGVRGQTIQKCIRVPVGPSAVGQHLAGQVFGSDGQFGSLLGRENSYHSAPRSVL